MADSDLFAARIQAMRADQDRRTETLRRAGQPSAQQLRTQQQNKEQLEARLAQLGYQRQPHRPTDPVDLDAL